MNNEILWLIRLGLDAKLFTREQALGVMKAVGRQAQLMDFAQKLIDDSLVQDVEKLETVAGQAMARAAAGPPPGNPLLDDEPAAPAAPAPRAAPGGSSPATGGAPQFPFDQIGTMDDAALAKGMRQLLIDTGKFGASHLQLSAASKPFIRKPRALTPIPEHPLTDQE